MSTWKGDYQRPHIAQSTSSQLYSQLDPESTAFKVDGQLEYTQCHALACLQGGGDKGTNFVREMRCSGVRRRAEGLYEAVKHIFRSTDDGECINITTGVHKQVVTRCGAVAETPSTEDIGEEELHEGGGNKLLTGDQLPTVRMGAVPGAGFDVNGRPYETTTFVWEM